MKSTKSNLCAKRRAFTLIELLTVIAIIAVLTAIIFPVFASAQENARRASCLTNMKTISTGVKQYQLDNRKYPDFLLTPAIKADTLVASANNDYPCLTITASADASQIGKLVAAQAGDKACSLEKASATGKLGGDVYVDAGGGTYTLLGTGSLYPEYVKSLPTFKCPDDSWFDKPGNDGVNYNTSPAAKDYPVTMPLVRYDTTNLRKTNLAAINTVRFYRYDCYDSNPIIAKDAVGKASNKFAAAEGIWTPRYNRQWMAAVPDPTAPGAVSPNANKHFYDHQLIWSNPTDDAYLTMCSYHAQSGKITVMTLGGTAKAIDEKVLSDTGNPVTALGTPTSNSTDFTSLHPEMCSTGDLGYCYVDFDPFRVTP